MVVSRAGSSPRRRPSARASATAAMLTAPVNLGINQVVSCHMLALCRHYWPGMQGLPGMTQR